MFNNKQTNKEDCLLTVAFVWQQLDEKVATQIHLFQLLSYNCCKAAIASSQCLLSNYYNVFHKTCYRIKWDALCHHRWHCFVIIAGLFQI